MPNVNQGKHCDMCSQNVHDLTDKSESEIHQLYQKNNGKLCGKIRPQQLDTSRYKQQRIKLAKFCLALFLVFGGCLFKTELHAQNSATKAAAIELDDRIDYYTLNGTVIDKETKEPIFFASVYYKIEGVKHGTSTDFDGKFNLRIRKNTILPDSIDLSVSSLGYRKMKVTGVELSKDVNTTLNLELEYDVQEITMGYIISCPPIINIDPESHGQTIITGEELRRSPY
jgi:hypothetical protein